MAVIGVFYYFTFLFFSCVFILFSSQYYKCCSRLPITLDTCFFYDEQAPGTVTLIQTTNFSISFFIHSFLLTLTLTLVYL